MKRRKQQRKSEAIVLRKIKRKLTYIINSVYVFDVEVSLLREESEGMTFEKQFLRL